MKFKILGYDGRSLKPFELSEIKAKDKEEAYEILNEETNFPCQDLVLTNEEFKQLKELLKLK